MKSVYLCFGLQSTTQNPLALVLLEWRRLTGVNHFVGGKCIEIGYPQPLY